jgi:serine/threonine protein kinase
MVGQFIITFLTVRVKRSYQLQTCSFIGDNGSEVCVRAVKRLRGAATSDDRKEFLREAELMLDFDHQNLVRLIGVAVQQKPWLVVLEYMRVCRASVVSLRINVHNKSMMFGYYVSLQYGDLRGVVRACKERKIVLSFLEQLKFCVQIAAGMAYLAGLNLLLSCNHVLLMICN